MTTAIIVLFILGLLGALDILLYHTVSHGIRSHPQSKLELLTHAARGPTYAAIFLLIPNFELRGVFAWLMLALLIFDVAISILDFSLERASRQLLGGLPSGEYVLHMVMAMLFGAFFALLFPHLYSWSPLGTELYFNTRMAPAWLRLVFAVMAVLVLLSGFADLRAALKHSQK